MTSEWGTLEGRGNIKRKENIGVLSIDQRETCLVHTVTMVTIQCERLYELQFNPVNKTSGQALI